MVKRNRRVNVTLLDDNAALWEICLTQLGIDEKGRSKAKTDQLLMELSLAALEQQIRNIGFEKGVRFPDYAMVAEKLGIKPPLDSPEPADTSPRVGRGSQD